MQPNDSKIKEALDKEMEALRKLNYSAVMPVDFSGQVAKEPTRLLSLMQKHGVWNNRVLPPQTANKFYQALVKL